MAPLLKPSKFSEDEYIYIEGDVVKSVHFCYAGISGFVYAAKNNIVYATVTEGDFIGLVDLIAAPKRGAKEGFVSKWYFTVQCLSTTSEFLELSLEQINKIRAYFATVFDELFFLSISYESKLTYLK